jgi:hypothetical protein
MIGFLHRKKENENISAEGRDGLIDMMAASLIGLGKDYGLGNSNDKSYDENGRCTVKLAKEPGKEINYMGLIRSFQSCGVVNRIPDYGFPCDKVGKGVSLEIDGNNPVIVIEPDASASIMKKITKSSANFFAVGQIMNQGIYGNLR